MNLRRMPSATEEEIFGAGAGGAEPRAGGVHARDQAWVCKTRRGANAASGVTKAGAQLPYEVIGGAILRHGKGNASKGRKPF